MQNDLVIVPNIQPLKPALKNIQHDFPMMYSLSSCENTENYACSLIVFAVNIDISCTFSYIKLMICLQLTSCQHKLYPYSIVLNDEIIASIYAPVSFLS